MNLKDLDLKFTEIEKLIFDQRLDQAFSKLRYLESLKPNYSIQQDIEAQSSNYASMLYYYFEGAVDAERQNVYDTVRRNLLDIRDRIKINLLQQSSSNYYFEKLRIESIKVTNLATMIEELNKINEKISLNNLLEDTNIESNNSSSLFKEKETLLIEIFNNIFSKSKLTNEDYELLNSTLDDDRFVLQDKSLFISAIFLSALSVFDIYKVQILLNKCVSEKPLIAARSLVSSIILLQYYKERLTLYPQIKTHVESLSENNQIRSVIVKIIIQLIRARETERVSKKMMDEILPEMIKFSKIAGKKINLEDIANESDFFDKNPDWKNLRDPNINKKIQEYSEMESEGFDVFHSTFSALKNFSFFNEISNWFLLFDLRHTTFADLISSNFDKSLLVKTIIDTPRMCNSDKYSLFLSLMQAPASHREMMLNSLGGNIDSLEGKEYQPIVPIDFETYSNQYIQDLYRFFKLSRKKDDFVDIFEIKIDASKDGVLSYFIKNNDELLKIANFCFEKNMYSEALGFINKVIEQGENTGIIWQMKGYCLQMTNQQSEALDAYLKSDIIEPDKIWTLKRIAQIYRNQNNFQKALEYYEQILITNPDNTSILLHVGQCYYQLKEYEKALNSYYKVELLDKTTSKTKRAIAWISFLTDKLDIAENYYSYLLENSPADEDYLNAAHVQLVKGNIKNALNLYSSSYKNFKTEDDFFKILDEDKAILDEKNIDKNFIYFLCDYLHHNYFKI